MFLSSFELNLNHRDARRDLGNPYEMHRTLTRLVEGGHGLWRLEGRRVLLLSDSPPQWAEIPSDYFAAPASSKAYPIEKMKLRGRRLRFRLLANPSKSIKEGLQREDRGKRVHIFREPDLLAWLKRQGERNGFSPAEVTTSQVGEMRFRKKRGQAEVVLGSCLFDGLLLVDNEERFKAVLREGVGRAKAFGLGLLSVAPG